MNRRVLLVDDQPEGLRGIARLMGSDYDVELAASCGEALDKLRTSGPYAVVVSEVETRGESGVGFLERLREECPDTVRVLVAGDPSVELALEATNRAEVFRFIEKPCAGDVLRSALEAAVSRYESAARDEALIRELDQTRRSVECFAEGLDRGRTAADPVEVVAELAREASAAATLNELAGLVIERARDFLPGRAIRMELYTGRRRDDFVSLRTGTAMAAPVQREAVETAEGEVGQVIVGGREGGGLDEEESRVLRALVSITAVAVHNHIRRRERDEAQHAVIFGMARLAEARDNETGKHIERVSSYCALVAEALAERPEYASLIDALFVEDIVRSAPLHDVGKVGIPDAILLKPGRLDAGEWKIMQTHAQIGADILRRVTESTRDPGFLLMAHDIAWCHHERWDGKGYPRGLAGVQIPLAARILSVADCYDALTTRRPYKEPWSHGDAVLELRACSGTRFDPAVVDAFLAREDEARAIATSLADELEE